MMFIKMFPVMGRTFDARCLSVDQQNAIVRGVTMGLPRSSLAKQFKINKSTISRILKRLKTRGRIIHKMSTGRPRVTSSLIDRAIITASRSNPRLTAMDIHAEITKYYTSSLSARTVRRRLQSAGLFARRPAKKPYITPKNRRARVAWAKEHLTWTAQQWRNVLFSDESKYALFGSDGQQYIRRPRGKKFDPAYQLPSIKHGGGSCMVWGCFSMRGMGPLFHLKSIMDRHVYLEILEKVMLPYARNVFGRELIYQDDNDPKHQSKDVKNWFAHKRITRMEWPSSSPDLNLIEHMWEVLDRRIRGKKVANVKEKFELLSAEWKKIPQSTIDALIDSMPRRCEAVIKAKGYATKY